MKTFITLIAFALILSGLSCLQLEQINPAYEHPDSDGSAVEYIPTVQEKTSAKEIRIGIFTSEQYWDNHYTDDQGIELNEEYAANGTDIAITSRLDSIGQVLDSGIKAKQLFGHKIQYSIFIGDATGVPVRGSVYAYIEDEVDHPQVLSWSTPLFQTWCDAHGWHVIAPSVQKNIYWLIANK